MLIVDDDLATILFLAEVFDDTYDLQIAGSGETALLLLSDKIPDVILLDVSLPGMDGFEVCRQIRENRQLNKVKIIMQTARATQNDFAQGFEAGANNYITKPYDHESIIEKMMNMYGLIQ